MVEMILFPMEDYPVDHPALIYLSSILPEASKIIRVKRENTKETGQCYNNALNAAIDGGGDVVLGWMVTWFPDVYISAMHHAIWRKADGTYVDVTATQLDQADGENYTTFARDSSIKVNFDCPMPVTNRHIVLIPDDDIKKSLEYYMINNAARRKLLEAVNKDPRYSFTSSGNILGPDINAIFPSICAEQDSSLERMHYYRRRFYDKYSVPQDNGSQDRI